MHEQVNSGMTVIEKIEKYSDVEFGIVLYTPCDLGYVKGKKKEKRPGQDKMLYLNMVT